MGVAAACVGKLANSASILFSSAGSNLLFSGRQIVPLICVDVTKGPYKQIKVITLALLLEDGPDTG